MKALSTQLQDYINLQLENHEGFSKQMTPNKYKRYTEIRSKVSKHIGITRPLGIVEYYESKKYVDLLFTEKEITDEKSGKSDK